MQLGRNVCVFTWSTVMQQQLYPKPQQLLDLWFLLELNVQHCN